MGVKEAFSKGGDVRGESRSTMRGKLYTELGMKDESPRKN